MTEAQRKVLRALLLPGFGKLHHGDAVGADAEAHDIAVALGRGVVIHPASLPERRAFKSAPCLRSPKAPFTRNKIIVRETSVLIHSLARGRDKAAARKPCAQRARAPQAPHHCHWQWQGPGSDRGQRLALG